MKIYLECRVVSCKACGFTVFCQKKCHKKTKKTKQKTKKNRKTVTLGWTDISSPGPASFLSRSSMYYVMLTLYSSINLLNVVSTNSFS